MVEYMLKGNNLYKDSDILDESFKSRMNSYFNPYEYNLDSTMKNDINMDMNLMKSKSHLNRKQIKK